MIGTMRRFTWHLTAQGTLNRTAVYARPDGHFFGVLCTANYCLVLLVIMKHE